MIRGIAAQITRYELQAISKNRPFFSLLVPPLLLLWHCMCLCTGWFVMRRQKRDSWPGYCFRLPDNNCSVDGDLERSNPPVSPGGEFPRWEESYHLHCTIFLMERFQVANSRPERQRCLQHPSIGP